MKKPTRPKLLKLPRKPKAGATIQQMERYLSKVKEVQKANIHREKAHQQALKNYESDKAYKKRLRETISGLESVRRYRKSTTVRYSRKRPRR